MARLDVFPNPGGVGYLLDVQADLLEELNTRVVVPLLPKNVAPKPIGRLNPVFTIGVTEYVMATQLLAAIPRRALGTAVTNLGPHHSRIVEALDMLITGV
ncbi:CcdB family protein [Salinarimonas rosea]|uniref:CcdB family protein n=1 Tax=Salinarimonas rosea TaxID=552063 RepID=UPI000410D765|nr:CcdB family protein [Salinarimonas rosea]